jgi:short-subunit dehydrogenase
MKKYAFFESVIIITGASSGIGAQLALRFAEQGAWLALAARTTESLNKVAKKCQEQGGKAIIIPTDVSDQSQCQNLIQNTIEEYGRIDILINNAGFAIASRFDQFHDLSLFEKVIQVNFFGSVYCTYYALPYLKASSGRLVAVSSLRGKFPSATADGYGASKHALAEFFESLRNELRGSGVSVTIIYPGYVSTGITSRLIKSDGQPTNEISKFETGAMSVETCSKIIINAVKKRKHHVLMTLHGKLRLYMNLIAPRTVDKIIRKRAGY